MNENDIRWLIKEFISILTPEVPEGAKPKAEPKAAEPKVESKVDSVAEERIKALTAENERLREEITRLNTVFDKKVNEQVKKATADSVSIEAVSELWGIALNCLNDIYKSFTATTKEDFNKCDYKEFMTRFAKNCASLAK